jgi:hypothetical protein
MCGIRSFSLCQAVLLSCERTTVHYEYVSMLNVFDFFCLFFCRFIVAISYIDEGE